MAVGLAETMETRIRERSAYAAAVTSSTSPSPKVHHQRPMYRPPPPSAINRAKTPGLEPSSYYIPPPPQRPKSSAAHGKPTNGARENARQQTHPSRQMPNRNLRREGEEPRTKPTVASPWSHMAQTYTWVAEQEYVKHNKKGHWVPVLQQSFLVSDPSSRDQAGKKGVPTNAHPLASGRTWEELAYGYEAEAERWMRVQEETRKKALEKEKQKALFEHARRAESIRRRKESEQKRMAEERSRAYAAAHQEQERRDRAAKMSSSDKMMVIAWETYESRWTHLNSTSDLLKFNDVPWPMLLSPSSVQKITPSAVVSFLLSPYHSKGLSYKERIRCAQLRWHPDRFRKILGRVHKDHSEAVETGVGIVARCLNDLMSRETTTGSSLLPSQRGW